MKITIVGATGMAGSRVVAEATRRGHDVTAVSRGGTDVRADAQDRDRMAELFTGTDAVVAATRPVPGQEQTVTTALLDAAAATRTRILVIGGAGPLRTPGRPELPVADNPDYVPSQWRTIAAASVAQFEACQGHPADWSYLSPPAVLEPGLRTGTYRRGATTLLTAPDGTSRISAEDFAVAVVDELENPSTARHFTVAY
jgi:putative NADH-flavin reductase